jgi:hypothetical protein
MKMTNERARTRRGLMLLALASTTALVGAACMHRPRPPRPRPTTTATTAAPTTAEPTTTAPASTTTTTTGHGHGHDPDPADDKGWSLLKNGQSHPHPTEEVPLDAATQAELDRQLAVTRTLVQRYPTVGAAEAAGYRRAGPFSPGLGAHYMEPITAGNLPGGGTPTTGLLSDEQLLHPLLVFNGVTPEAELVGFMYMARGSTTAPDGFAGPNDVWHYHTNVCVSFGSGGVDVPLGADRDVTAEQCQAVGGRLIPNTGHMAHLWSVPGWENPEGLFGELNPKITCQDGTYYTIPLDQIGTATSTCRDAQAG